VQILFDSTVISYREILEIFFTMHNPTTLNRQDYDIGDFYRSVIFYHSYEQQQLAADMLPGFAHELWDDPVVTQLVPFEAFWPADDTMQDYYSNNPNAGYCLAIINPKVQKLRQKFSAKLKPE
jgi:peptide-methionine (S)-S-oxide reductase